MAKTNKASLERPYFIGERSHPSIEPNLKNILKIQYILLVKGYIAFIQVVITDFYSRKKVGVSDVLLF
jgi:hypothetical protein